MKKIDRDQQYISNQVLYRIQKDVKSKLFFGGKNVKKLTTVFYRFFKIETVFKKRRFGHHCHKFSFMYSSRDFGGDKVIFIFFTFYVSPRHSSPPFLLCP
jgi:hypothetical protein